MQISKCNFGTLPNGESAQLFTLENQHQTVLKLTDYGAIVVAVELPDRSGQRHNVTLGFDSLDGYLQQHPHFGSTIGRFCNRIGFGKFELDGKSYQLARNNGAHHLHGGSRCFDTFLWTAEPIESTSEAGLRFTRTSPDGEESYPGNLQVSVSYVLTENNELRIDFEATTDAATPINLTNHCYWNLAGAMPGAPQVLDHELTLFCSRYLPVDDGLIPTGELAPVAGTPMDFTSSKKMGADFSRIESDPVGYDHCFAIDGDPDQLKLAAKVVEPSSGRVMQIETTQPGIQFYTGNFLDGSSGTAGFGQHQAFCLETQHFPDSPNKPEFPSTILRPGQTFRQSTIHRFSLI